MTDANLMDADCIHGNTWWECPTCELMDKIEMGPNIPHPWTYVPNENRCTASVGNPMIRCELPKDHAEDHVFKAIDGSY